MFQQKKSNDIVSVSVWCNRQQTHIYNSAINSVVLKWKQASGAKLSNGTNFQENG